MDVRKVKKLIELLEESSIVAEIEIREGEELVRISRTPPAASAESHKPAEQSIATAAETASRTGTAPPTPVADRGGSETEVLVKSPMVGTFYRAPRPGVPPFVERGDRVQKGQTLCIIEAMKTMNQIEAAQAGTIKLISVEDGDPVEYGQSLFSIETA